MRKYQKLYEMRNVFLKQFLNDNVEFLHSMAKSLLVHETIDSKDIDKLLNGKKIIRRKSKQKIEQW